MRPFLSLRAVALLAHRVHSPTSSTPLVLPPRRSLPYLSGPLLTPHPRRAPSIFWQLPFELVDSSSSIERRLRLWMHRGCMLAQDTS
jgi:hypothetical protein